MEYRHLPPDDVLGAVLGLSELNAPGKRQPNATSKPVPAAARRPRPAAAPSPTQQHNLRTEEGRAAYDGTVLVVMQDLGGEKLPAKQIREQAGGTSPQFRASVDRLIEAKKVVFEGKAAGMRYSLAKQAKPESSSSE